MSLVHETASERSIGQSVALGALPNIDEATLLVFPDVDNTISRAIAGHQDALTDWSYGPVDLADEVRKIRSWSRDLLHAFFPSRCAPQFVFRFEREGPRVLGHYVPGRNDAGLRWEISINPRHLCTRSERQVAAVLLHELLHSFEEAVRPPRRTANGYRSAWFRSFAEELGIPCTRYGAELGIITPSRFTSWADERGLREDATSEIQAAALVVDEPLSKRVPWVCACPPAVLVTVQVPRGSELLARCERCDELFKRKAKE
jgi:hypothetical protein